MSKYKSFPIIGTKSSLLWDEDTDAWVYLSGEPIKADDPRSYYKIVPTLYRAVDIRASAIANLPWAIYRGETEYDTSENYEDKAGLISNMNSMLYLIEASLTLAGSAYWKREKNPAGYDKLRHLNPTSMVLDEKKAHDGIIEWKRNEPEPKIYTPKEIIYFWYPDPYVEIGPPSAWPVQTALAACGVLANVDEFARNYFGRGAIKAMIFAMQGTSQDAAKDFESWWNRFISGISNAFRTKVINAEEVSPVVIGEGIKELENVTLSQEKREEIAIACAIPMSILFANAANYATAERDKLNWYEDKIVPEAKWVAAVLNEQLFEPMGLRFRFLPETLDIFQEDETQRAEAMNWFMDAMTKANTIEMAQALFMIYGVEVGEEAMALIEKHFAEKAERAEQMQEQLQPASSGPMEPPDEEEDEDEEQATRQVDTQQLQRELSIWQSKCLSALKRGEAASSIAFVPVHIPTENYDRIVDGLTTAEDAEMVKDVFVAAFRDDAEQEPEIDRWEALTAEIATLKDMVSNPWLGYP